ncbi:MAG: glycosyltransferase family 4 protein [Candidatus Paceibacterota bacterium]
MNYQKNIYFVSAARIPSRKAHTVSIIKMCEAFREQGFQVTLVIPSYKHIIPKILFRKYGVSYPFNIHAVSVPNITFFPSSMRDFILRMVFALRAWYFIQKDKHRVVITRDWFLLFFFKGVIFLHGRPSFGRRMWKRRLSRTSVIVVVNSIIKGLLIEKGILREKIIVAPNGVNIGVFNINISQEAARSKVEIPKNDHIVMYTGSFYLYDWKGIDVLLDSIEHLAIECTVVLIGGSRAEIESIKKIYNHKNLMLVEHVPHSDIPFYLKSANVLVLPNTGDSRRGSHYTSPVKLFEYMASGVPIVASQLPAITKILNNKNACLVEPGNPKALARGITKVIQDREYADIRAEQAFLDVQQYTWKARAQKIINVIPE